MSPGPGVTPQVEGLKAAAVVVGRPACRAAPATRTEPSGAVTIARISSPVSVRVKDRSPATGCANGVPTPKNASMRARSMRLFAHVGFGQRLIVAVVGDEVFEERIAVRDLGAPA